MQTSFFSRRLVGSGTEVSLDLPVPSKWTIISKLSETASQLTARDVNDGISGPSYAQALLLCRSANPGGEEEEEGEEEQGEEAYMRIYMQIPYQGTEFQPAEDRARQASSRTHNELVALQTFTAKGSTITPTL
jgi:ADP-ribosylglycohydrolase